MSTETQKYTDASFGMVQFSRVSFGGAGRKFHASDIYHRDGIILRIAEAESDDQYGRTWFRASSRRPLVEVYLSGDQFATLLTSMNMGDGVPCTISYEHTKGNIPFPEYTETKIEKSNKYFKESVEEVYERLANFEKALDQVKLSQKDKKLLSDHVYSVRQQIEKNLPYVVETFKETMGKIIVEGKAAIESFYTGIVARTGMNMMQMKRMENDSLKQLEEKDSPPQLIE